MKNILERENELVQLKRDIEIILKDYGCLCIKCYECLRCSILRRLKELQEYKEEKKEVV